jgi:hypothetical protein
MQVPIMMLTVVRMISEMPLSRALGILYIPSVTRKMPAKKAK